MLKTGLFLDFFLFIFHRFCSVLFIVHECPAPELSLRLKTIGPAVFPHYSRISCIFCQKSQCMEHSFSAHARSEG
jgi:hypothetical protein